MKPDHEAAKKLAQKKKGDEFPEGWGGILNLAAAYLELCEQVEKYKKVAGVLKYSELKIPEHLSHLTKQEFIDHTKKAVDVFMKKIWDNLRD